MSNYSTVGQQVERDVANFKKNAARILEEVALEADAAENAEDAIQVITLALVNLLGDRNAHLQPGNLKKGEFQQFACGAFFLTPDGISNQLIAPINYHPDQLHMKLDSTIGHPGWMVKNQKPLLLVNTDLDKSFVKILRTFRAGSVCYAPIKSENSYFGQIICAAQGRNTMTEDDLAVHISFCQLASTLWVAKDGPNFLKSIN